MNTKTLDSRRQRATKAWRSFGKGNRPIIFIGTGSCGLAAGARDTMDAAQTKLKELKVDADLVQVGCIGPCYLEPLMDIQIPGSPRISFGNVDARMAEHLLTKVFSAEEIPANLALGHFGENGETATGIPSFWEHPMLKGQVRNVLRNCGIIDPGSIDHYLARNGYQGLVAALAAKPAKALDTVKASGLRGRGGAGFPTWFKWQACADQKSAKKFMICNADEGDPGAFMDRSLIEGDPHAVLEGMLIAGYTIGAEQGYIYIRAEYPLAISRLRNAITQMKKLGLLGQNILGSGFNFDLKIKEGAGAFVCGEETSLIASIEGRRGMPRNRPPFPAQKGLFDCPTIINNVETLGNLPNIIRLGSDWFNQLGTEKSKGTKTFALVGRVRRTGLVEVPMGMSLRQIVFDIGGGLSKPFKAVQTGGPSGGCLSEEFLDTPIDYDNLAKAGSIMGSGGLIIMDEDTCVVDLARYFLNFTQQESCGKCVPCRVGTRHLVDILERITKGEGVPEDLPRLEKLGTAIKSASLCGLGQTAPNPVISTLKYFRHEYLEHIQEKRCPAAICRDLVMYRVEKDKCTGCQQCVKVCPTDAIHGPRSEPHNIDEEKCIKCRACYEACRFDAIAGDAIRIVS